MNIPAIAAIAWGLAVNLMIAAAAIAWHDKSAMALVCLSSMMAFGCFVVQTLEPSRPSQSTPLLVGSWFFSVLSLFALVFH